MLQGHGPSSAWHLLKGLSGRLAHPPNNPIYLGSKRALQDIQKATIFAKYFKHGELSPKVQRLEAKDVQTHWSLAEENQKQSCKQKAEIGVSLPPSQ